MGVEDEHDPLSGEEFRDLQNSFAQLVAELYRAMRKVVRRFCAAKGQSVRDVDSRDIDSSAVFIARG